MATKFSEIFAIRMLKKHRKFCRRGLTHLDATPTFKNHPNTYGPHNPEGASDQFPIWIFNFWPYGQLRAIRGKNLITYIWIMSDIWAPFFHVFMCKKKKKKSNFYLNLFCFKIVGCLWDLSPACKSRGLWGSICSITFVIKQQKSWSASFWLEN